MNKIAVLIPCYNEALTVAKVIADYKSALPNADIYMYMIIIPLMIRLPLLRAMGLS